MKDEQVEGEQPPARPSMRDQHIATLPWPERYGADAGAAPAMAAKEELSPDLSPEEEQMEEALDMSPEEEPPAAEDPPLDGPMGPDASTEDAVLSPTGEPTGKPTGGYVPSAARAHVQRVIQGQSPIQNNADVAEDKVIKAAKDLREADRVYRVQEATTSPTWPTRVKAAEKLQEALDQANALAGPAVKIRFVVPEQLRTLMALDLTVPETPAMAAAPVLHDARCANPRNATAPRLQDTSKKRARSTPHPKLKVHVVGSPEHLAAVERAKAAQKPRDAANSRQRQPQKPQQQAAASSSSSSSHHETARPAKAAASSSGDHIICDNAYSVYVRG